MIIYTYIMIYFIVLGGVDLVFSVFQSFLDQTTSGWCFFTVEDSVYGVMLRKLSLVVYRWQGTFIPVEVNITLCFMVHELKCI